MTRSEDKFRIIAEAEENAANDPAVYTLAASLIEERGHRKHVLWDIPEDLYYVEIPDFLNEVDKKSQGFCIMGALVLASYKLNYPVEQNSWCRMLRQARIAMNLPHSPNTWNNRLDSETAKEEVVAALKQGAENLLQTT